MHNDSPSASQKKWIVRKLWPKQRYVGSTTWCGQSRSIIAPLSSLLRLGTRDRAMVAARTRRSAPGEGQGQAQRSLRAALGLCSE